jgi:hypothetical protein
MPDRCNGAGSASTITATAVSTASWAAFKDITGATSTITCTTCFDLKGNCGTLTFNAPVLGSVTASGVIGG